MRIVHTFFSGSPPHTLYSIKLRYHHLSFLSVSRAKALSRSHSLSSFFCWNHLRSVSATQRIPKFREIDLNTKCYIGKLCHVCVQLYRINRLLFDHFFVCLWKWVSLLFALKWKFNLEEKRTAVTVCVCVRRSDHRYIQGDSWLHFNISRHTLY